MMSPNISESELFRTPPETDAVASGSRQVLVVCEDPYTRALIVFGLRCAGFAVRDRGEVSGAPADAIRNPPDLILLKVQEFVRQGLTFTQAVKKHSRTRSTPLIVISDERHEADGLLSLEAGADDYMALPFAPGELIARIQTLLRHNAPGTNGESLQLHGFTLNPATHRISVGNRTLHAPPTEYRFLELLLRNPEHIFTRAELFRRIWGAEADIDERTVDVYVLRVRKILAAAGLSDLLQTIRGSGYCLSGTAPQKR